MAVVSMRCSIACLTGGSHLLAPTTALYFCSSLLAAPTCWLAASCPAPLLGASTVGSEGVEGSTAGSVAASLTTLGFLAAPACRLAACLPGQRLLGEGVEVSASTVGREGGEGTTGGGAAATTPVTTAALVRLCKSGHTDQTHHI